jgi:hypothetical protein
MEDFRSQPWGELDAAWPRGQRPRLPKTGQSQVDAFTGWGVDALTGGLQGLLRSTAKPPTGTARLQGAPVHAAGEDTGRRAMKDPRSSTRSDLIGAPAGRSQAAAGHDARGHTREDPRESITSKEDRRSSRLRPAAREAQSLPPYPQPSSKRLVTPLKAAAAPSCPRR